MAGALLMVKYPLLARVLQFEVLEGLHIFSVSVSEYIIFERVYLTNSNLLPDLPV